MKEHLDAIISVISGLAGVALGFFLQKFSDNLTEKKKLKEEFLYLKNTVLFTTVSNNLNPELLKLRDFFIRHTEFLEKRGNKYFFETWLQNVFVEVGYAKGSGGGMWDKTRIQRMMEDLEKVKP